MIIFNKEESLNPDWIRWPQGGVLALLYTCDLGKFLSLSKAVSVQFSSVQFIRSVCTAQRTEARFLVYHQLLELTLTHVHWVGDAIQPSQPLLSPSPPAFNLRRIRVFSNDSVLCIRWPRYWSFSFNINPSNEHSGLISFRKDWLDLLAVQGTLSSLLLHQSSKALVLWCSAFFMVQLSHPYMITGKTIALTRQTFVGKVMSLLFNMLFKLVTAFLQGASVF